MNNTKKNPLSYENGFLFVIRVRKRTGQKPDFLFTLQILYIISYR